MSILPAERYDEIRYTLDPGLDEEAVPDGIITSLPYLGQAEKWALETDPLAMTRTGEEQESLYAAIIFRTAGLLSVATPQARQINQAGHNVTLVYAETPMERTQRLLQTAYDYIASYLTVPETTTLDAPLFVTTVAGRRG